MKLSKEFYIGTLISILLFVLPYLIFTSKKEITYNINSISKVFNSKVPKSQFKIISIDSSEILEDIYLITGSVWNNGNKSILKEDVRVPLEMKVQNSKRLLEFRVGTNINDTVSNFELSEIDSTRLRLDWRYFDAEQGFYFYIVCESKEEPSLILSGKILDIKEIKQYYPFTSEEPLRLLYIITFPLGFILIPLISALIQILRNKMIYTFKFWILCLLIFVDLLTLYYLLSKLNAPFNYMKSII